MAKVHITLVGREIEPIYNGIIYSQPDFIYFIRSSDEKSLANARTLARWFSSIPSEDKKVDPVDMDDIKNKVEQIAERFKNDEVTINISSGTKPWSYFFSIVFGTCSNAEIFYVDQKNRVWNFTNLQQAELPYDFKTAIQLHTGNLPKYTNYIDFTTEDIQVVNKIVNLDRFNHAMFSALVAQARKHPNLGEWISRSHRLIKNGKKFSIDLYNANKEIHENLESPHSHSLLVNAGWFEYVVARVVKHWDKSQDVWLNCVFPFANNSIKNEIDIIANLGDRMLFVECKTKMEDYKDIDKFHSAMLNYAGKSTIGLFVANEPLNEQVIEKCRDNKILAFSFGDYQSEKEAITALVKKLEEQYVRMNS